MTRQKMMASEALVETMAAEGVKYCFGIVGTHSHIVFNKYLEPAILCTQYTSGFMPGSHCDPPLTPHHFICIQINCINNLILKIPQKSF